MGCKDMEGIWMFVQKDMDFALEQRSQIQDPWVTVCLCMCVLLEILDDWITVGFLVAQW